MDSARGEPAGDADHPGVLFAGTGAMSEDEGGTLGISGGVLAHGSIVERLKGPRLGLKRLVKPVLAVVISMNVDLLM